MSGVGVEELLAARGRAEKASSTHAAACASIIQPLERYVRLLEEKREGAVGKEEEKEGGDEVDRSRREECERLGESVRAAATSVSRGSSVHAANKDVHAGVSRLSRRLEAVFDVDTERAYRGDLRWWDVRGAGTVSNIVKERVSGHESWSHLQYYPSTRQELLDFVIVQHLLRTGESELAATMIDECCGADDDERRTMFEGRMMIFNEMHDIVAEIEKGELGPVLAWTEERVAQTRAGEMSQYWRSIKRRKRHVPAGDGTAAGVSGDADKDRPCDDDANDEEDVDDDAEQEGDGAKAIGEHEVDEIEPYFANVLAMQVDLNNLLFHIHQQRFLSLLVGRDSSTRAPRLEALAYGRVHLARFHSTHMKEVQRLFGCLVYDTKLANSPYADLIGGFDVETEANTAGAAYASLRDEFITNWCCCFGMSRVSSLSIALDAGALALGQLLKLINVMETTGGNATAHGLPTSSMDFASQTGTRTSASNLASFEQYQNQTAPSITSSGTSTPGELPIELHLGDEFVFQSIFSCPVSREQSAPENPPMLLPCGHVLCRGSVLRLGRGAARVFKCPYCPKECTMGQCRELHF